MVCNFADLPNVCSLHVCLHRKGELRFIYHLSGLFAGSVQLSLQSYDTFDVSFEGWIKYDVT